MAAEPRTTPGGQPWYSALAILTALTLRAVFRLAYRQAEGLLGSVVGLLGLALRVPDHTTLCGQPGSSNHLCNPALLPRFQLGATTFSWPAPPRTSACRA